MVTSTQGVEQVTGCVQRATKILLMVAVLILYNNIVYIEIQKD